MPTYIKRPAIYSLRVILQPNAEQAFIDWQAAFNASVVQVRGFISLEFLNRGHDWIVVQRFAEEASAAGWLESVEYGELIEKLKGFASFKEMPSDEVSQAGVTEVIIAQVNPETESEYLSWSAKIHQAEARFPGFRGAYLQKPEVGKGRNWITLLQFDTMDHLDAWLNSDERQRLLNESMPWITSLETHRVISPYAGWFASIAKKGEMPAVWKQTMLVLLVLFPIVMFELRYLTPSINFLGPSLSTFIANAISVSLISFPMMPIAIYFLGWWLAPIHQRKRIAVLGIVVVVILYLIEIALLWNFLPS